MKQSALTIIAPLAALDHARLEEKRAEVQSLGKALDACVQGARAALDPPLVDGAARPSSSALLASGGASDIRELDPGRRATPPDPMWAVIESDLRAFLVVASVHYMSVFFMEPENGAPALIGIEVNADGNARSSRRWLAHSAPTFLRRLLKGCVDLQGEAPPEALQRFLARHTRRQSVFFAAFPGRSVSQIRGEQNLRLDTRGEFVKAVASPGILNEPPTDTSPLQAPSSASAMWEYLRLKSPYRHEPLLQHGPRRPFTWRWDLKTHGIRDQMNHWGNRVFWALLVVMAVAWFCTSALANGFASGVAPLAFVVPGLGVLLTWWREAPRHAKGIGRQRVLAAALWTALAMGATWACALGGVGMVLRAIFQVARPEGHSPFALAYALLRFTHHEAVPLIAGGAMAGTLSRWGIHLRLVGAAVLAISAAALLFPFEVGSYLLGAIAVGLGLVVFATATLVAHVMSGPAAAVMTAMALATLSCAWVPRGLQQDWPLASWIAIESGALALLTMGTVGWIAVWLCAVRRAEERENGAEPPPPLPDVGHLAEVEHREDVWPQNHLIVVSRVKEGRLRIVTLRRVLRIISLAAKWYFNQGDLGGIQTIHFAQFTLLEDCNPKRLILLSNYDAAFGSYLQEFNRVIGVTAIWSNCVGFPPAFGLVADGASDEQRLKQFGRRNQIPSLGWYSAYPHLFLRDIETATETREKLRRHVANPSTLAGQVRAWLGRPLSEADCDAALQRL